MAPKMVSFLQLTAERKTPFLDLLILLLLLFNIIFDLNRDIALKQTTVNRLEELQNELKLESKQRLENEVEMRTSLEATNTKMKMYCDESVEAARQITVVNYYLNAPFY